MLGETALGCGAKKPHTRAKAMGQEGMGADEGSQELRDLENELHFRARANDALLLELAHLDQKIDETLKRERRFLRLKELAQKKREQLLCELSKAEEKLVSLRDCHRVAAAGVASAREATRGKRLPVSAFVRGSDGVANLSRSVDVVKSRCDMAALHRRLHEMRSHYRRVVHEIQQLELSLGSIATEEASATFEQSCMAGAYNSKNAAHVEYQMALRDLVGSFQEITGAVKAHQ
uniref:Uncharacterized protein n=1 Tax=Trypanosoma vivax (strain Y486) TaxID=1055687 RepID=G0TTW6_TRYVY|nr:conserved hypothetical protein [Trypanosoma vivax Y486]